MSLRQEGFQPFSVDYQLTTIPRDQMLSFKQDQMFGDSRPRGADQFGEIPMPSRQRQTYPFGVGSAEIFAQLEQDQSQPLFQCAAHEICATQLNQIPAPQVARRHPPEVRRSYPERYFDEALELNCAYAADGDRFAAKIIADAGHRRRKAGNHAGRDHYHQRALALAIAARDPGYP